MFNNRTIGQRLAIGFGILNALMIIIIGYGLYELNNINQASHKIISEDWAQATLANKIDTFAHKRALSSMELFYLTDQGQIDKTKTGLQSLQKQIGESLDQLEKISASDVQARELIKAVRESRKPYENAANRSVQLLLEQRQWEEATKVMTVEALPALEKFMSSVDNMRAYQKKVSDQNAAKASDSYSWAFSGLIVLGLISIGAGIFCAIMVARSITGPLFKTLTVIQEMSKGHLRHRLHFTQQDEIGNIGRAMDSFAEDLQKVVVGSMQKLADGDVHFDVQQKDQQDEITPAVKKILESLRGLISEISGLTQSAIQGKLEKRGNTEVFKGSYHDIVKGINETLDAIVDPLNESATVLERLAKRDLTARIQGDYQGDHARIKTALNTAIKNLDEGLTQVAVTAEQVNSASSQINSGSEALSQSASEQAASLEEVSSSLQEMASMTKQNAANAKEARSVSESTRTSTVRGMENMRRLSEAINKIKASADATAKIVKTIDEIAFQTNLLALNAAVEAARAGDAGKGFAVVAEEVRNLAMRSADAAKNTANMIEDSVRNAEGGVGINQEVLENLEEINREVNRVTEMMAEIATASDQQSQGIDQINSSIEQMNQITQQVAANAEESASAAQEMSGQSSELENLVNNFNLSNSGKGRAATVDYAAPAAGRIAKRTLTPPRRPALPGKSTSRDPKNVILFEDDSGQVLKDF
jgi:methyl-accepting chemotaxis protein